MSHFSIGGPSMLKVRGNISVGKKAREKVIRLEWENCLTNAPCRAKWLSFEDRLCAITVHLLQRAPHLIEELVMEVTRWLSSGSLSLSLLVALSLTLSVSLSSHSSLFSLLIRIILSFKLSKHTITLSFLQNVFFISFFLCLSPSSYPAEAIYASQLLLSFSEASTLLPPAPVIPHGLLQKTQWSPSLAGDIEWNLIRWGLWHQRMQRGLTRCAHWHGKCIINNKYNLVSNFMSQMTM